MHPCMKFGMWFMMNNVVHAGHRRISERVPLWLFLWKVGMYKRKVERLLTCRHELEITNCSVTTRTQRPTLRNKSVWTLLASIPAGQEATKTDYDQVFFSCDVGDGWRLFFPRLRWVGRWETLCQHRGGRCTSKRPALGQIMVFFPLQNSESGHRILFAWLWNRKLWVWVWV